MTHWDDIEHDPEDDATRTLATHARERIEAHGLALLATLRADGSPRISGVEPLFADGELWLGMMDGSRKAADLQRDPRLALHGATIDKEVRDGDVKLSGRAVEVVESEVRARYLSAFEASNGEVPPPGPFHLFRVDVTEVVSLRPAGDHLVIETWKEGRGVRRIERR